MNGHERITAALVGERPDTIPIMLHNFPMAARETGFTMADYRSDPAKIAQAHIMAVEKYNYDGVLVDVDTVTLAGAVGVPVDFPEDEPARCHVGCLNSLQEVDALEPVDIGGDDRVQIWLESCRTLKKHFGNEVFVRGNCDQAPFALASMMRGASNWMLDIVDSDNEELVHKLLEFCTDITSQFICLMVKTGVDMVSNGDSPAGPDMISPQMYRQFAWPYEKRIVDTAHANNTSYLLHICGDAGLILDDMIATGADVLELDYKTNIHLILEKCRGKTTFCGNIDPSGVLALGTPQLVRQKTQELIDIYAESGRFILNAGCAIPRATPPENLFAMINTARELTQR